MPRAQYIQIRVSAEEKALLQAAAKQSGLGLSEYLRREAGIGKFRRADLQGLKKTPAQRAQRVPIEATPDFEARVRKLQLRLPRVAAVRMVKKEMAGEAS